MIHWKRMASLMLLCAGTLLSAQSYPVYKFARAPEIDGKLNDRAWQRVPEGRGFRNLNKAGDFASERTTRFQMGYKDDFLYLAIECSEPDMKNLKAEDTYRDGWKFDDAVELFFLPAGKKEYMQLLVNAKGARWAKFRNAERETEPPIEWKTAAGRTPNSWILEMAIPISMLGTTDIADMKFNIGRNMPMGEKNKHQSWAKVIRGFGDAACFASMEKKLSNGTADIELESNEINPQYDMALYLFLREIAIGGKTWKEAESRYGKAEDFDKLRALRKKIASEYGRIPKSEYAGLQNEWFRTLSTVNTPIRTLSVSVKDKNIRNGVLLVNGEKVAAANGQYTFSIKEGTTVLAYSADAGPGASLAFAFKEFPELDKRWAVSNQAGADWVKLSFDDRAWKAFDGKFAPGKVYLRQVIIWNNAHDGRLRCLNPTTRRWEFSLDSVEPVYLSLYSPAGQKVNSFEFNITLPDGFRLLDMAPGARRNRLSIAPTAVTGKKLPNGTCYTLTYSPHDIHEWKTADSILGIAKDASGTPGTTGRIPYARRINHNVTEIDASLPYGILPRINGRRLPSMMMSFYMGSMPQGLSRELANAVIRDSIRCGFDTFSLYPKRNMIADLVAENGGRMMFGYLNHPIWGSKIADGAVTRMFTDHPELFCIQYNGKQHKKVDAADIPAHKLDIQFCPSLISGKYKDEFFKAVQADYRNFFFKDYPDTGYVFLNWEQEPWGGSVYTKSTNPEKAFCFCDLCKENFRQWASLPKTEDLSNKAIFTKYYEPWRKFRYSQDAAVHDIVIKALRGMGKIPFFYSWSNHYGYWEAAKNVDYEIFLGCPGNATADRRQQLSMDEYMKFHKGKLNRNNICGQRFVFFPQTYGWNTEREDGWLKFNVMSDDGYINPKTWKWETIRMLATMNGGYDAQNPLELVSGVKYYIGEATRLVAQYENIFRKGVRNEKLLESKDIAYPDVLVLTLGNERLVMLFNESETAKKVTVRNLQLKGGEKAKAYYADKNFDQAGELTLTIPANDVEAIHIR